jgi:chromosome segregation protein
MQLERELDPLRQRITELQLKEQAARLGCEQYMEQLLADGRSTWRRWRSIEAEGACGLRACRARSTACTARSQALGAVNLAALEELTTARERKTVPRRADADLTEAMNTLEDAIRKIDGETRELLAGTFNPSTSTSAACSPSCSAAARRGW